MTIAAIQQHGPLLRRLATRVVAGIAVLWAAATAAFLALHAMPGNVADILAGDNTYPGLRESLERQWGLDKPILVQYAEFLGRLAHGDLGTSYTMRQPVTSVIGPQVMPTVELAVAAGVLAVVASVLAAVLTAGRPRLRAFSSTVELVGSSVPVFWVGIVLLMIFSFKLKLFPVAGAGSVAALVLPAITLALPTAGVLSQVLRDAMERTLDQPFVTTVRARGVSEATMRVRHALKHALLPVLSLAGWLVGSLLGGAVITESVFSRPGLGSVTLNAVTTKDMPVVLAVVLIAAFVYVVVSTLVDVLHLSIDPRLRTA
ncbi:ABC transporter permease [Nocardioides sp. KR10-350]|uniref:ABC transporter permease n=1 Tax=Nocardioides cheoyonin TaxID=3156615 RepID=UPI0032B44321